MNLYIHFTCTRGTLFVFVHSKLSGQHHVSSRHVNVLMVITLQKQMHSSYAAVEFGVRFSGYGFSTHNTLTRWMGSHLHVRRVLSSTTNEPL